MQIIRIRLINSDGSTKGCEKAPIEVLKELKKIQVNEKGKSIDFDKLNLEEIHVDLNNLDESNYLVFKNSKEIIEKNFKSFFIGGDHSISYPIGNALAKTEENPLLIVFDAHADCLIGGKNPSNREWLRKLIEEDFFGFRVILVSSRNLSEEEIDFIKEKRITLISMDVLKEDLQGVCDLLMERARSSTGFLVTIDIDCIDPGFAPGAVDLEPGGMSSRELIYFVRRLSLLDNFKGAIISEINPDNDINRMTLKLGAKLIAEMIA
jgi:arginase family enzyme